MNLHALKSSRYLFAIGSILLLPSAAPCQEETPQVDRTDPTAVVAAYLEACQDSDVDTAVSLLVADDQMPQRIDMVMAMREFSLAPKPMYRFPEPAAPVLTEEPGVVLVKRTISLDQKFVLRQDENGLWLIDLAASMTATTGAEKPFLAPKLPGAGAAGGAPQPLGRQFVVRQDENGRWVAEGMGAVTTTIGAEKLFVSRFQGGGAVGGGPVERSPYECMNHLRTLAQGLDDYAADHGGTLPAADTWMDDIMPYVLDRELFKCPAAPDLECGYAFNIEVGGLALPRGWQARPEFVLLMEWGSGEPNANAFPAEMENLEPRHGDQILFATADRNTHFALKGETIEDVLNRNYLTDICSRRMRAICEAIRDYARDNAGLLPGADTWCDDIVPYLMDQPDGEDVFACPAFPDAPFGYAYNKGLEGKNATELVGHQTIVVLMESDLGTHNASVSAAEVVASDRHRAAYVGQGPHGSHFGYLSGSVSFTTTGQKPRTQ